jgi:hypothetical protein
VSPLFDAPTPEKTITAKPKPINPTSADITQIRDLIGDESLKSEAPPDDAGLYDVPTPQRIDPSQQTNAPILPASMTFRQELIASKFSPIKSKPLSLSTMTNDEADSVRSLLDIFADKPSLQNNSVSPQKSSPKKSPKKTSMKRSPSTLDQTRSPMRLLQHSQTHNTFSQNSQNSPAPATPLTPPLTTQCMLEAANQSFNAILPSPSPVAAPIPAAKLGFTPFRVLNSSPARDSLNVDSPLTYSPGKALSYSPGKTLQTGLEESLWGDIKGILGGWSLDEEVGKYVKPVEKESQGTSQSQELLTGR